MRKLAIFTLVMLASSKAFAFLCFEPDIYETLPDKPYFISKPQVPYCFHVRNCDDWEIDNYIREVNDYVNEMIDYSDAVRNYTNAVILYSNSVNEYVECEIDEVKNQHK